jgi:hypothetical protein
MKNKKAPALKYVLMASAVLGTMTVDAAQRLAAAGMSYDANDITALFARELEWIDSELTKEEFAPLKAEELIPFEKCGGAGVRIVTYQKVTEFGNAKFIGNGTTTLPRVDVAGTEYSVPVRNLGAAYAYTVFELLEIAENPTIKLDTARKEAAMNAIRRLHDATAMTGYSAFGLTGLYNDANVPVVSAITGAWATATADQILADVNKLTWAVYSNTKELYSVDTLLIPTTMGARFDQPRANTDTTVGGFILKNSPHVKKIFTSHYGETAGVGNVPRVVAYLRNPKVIRYGANEMFAEEPPQRKALDIEVPCHGRTSGTQIRKPLAMAYMEVG